MPWVPLMFATLEVADESIVTILRWMQSMGVSRGWYNSHRV